MTTERTYVPRMSPSALMTADELFHTSIPDKRVELVRGVLQVREPAGMRHGRVGTALGAQLLAYVRRQELGQVLLTEVGFKLESDPDTVRAPDVAFIRRDRMPHPEPIAYPALAPDLVVEVLSPRDRPGEVLAKVADWLNAGTRLIWVIDPQRRSARVYRPDGAEFVIGADGVLDGEDVLPGFRCVLDAIL